MISDVILLLLSLYDTCLRSYVFICATCVVTFKNVNHKQITKQLPTEVACVIKMVQRMNQHSSENCKRAEGECDPLYNFRFPAWKVLHNANS